MKFVTMQAHRLGKTYAIPQVSVLIDGHVSLTLIKSANAIRRHIVPVNSRARTRLRRHGTALMKARASHVPARSRAAHRRACICRCRRVHIRCVPRLRFYAGIRTALDFFALRRQRQSETANAY